MPSSALAGVSQVFVWLCSYFECLVQTGVVALVNNQILSLDKCCKEKFCTERCCMDKCANVAQTDVAWTNVAWTNVAWSNGTGPLVNSQGWFHKLEMSSTVLSLGGLGGEKLKLMLSQPSTAGTWRSWNWG